MQSEGKPIFDKVFKSIRAKGFTNANRKLNVQKAIRTLELDDSEKAIEDDLADSEIDEDEKVDRFVSELPS